MTEATKASGMSQMLQMACAIHDLVDLADAPAPSPFPTAAQCDANLMVANWAQLALNFDPAPFFITQGTHVRPAHVFSHLC